MKKLFNDIKLYNQKDSYFITIIKVIMLMAIFYLVSLLVPDLLTFLIYNVFNYTGNKENALYGILVCSQVLLFIIYYLIYRKDKNNYPTVKETKKINYVYGILIIVGTCFLSLYLMEITQFYVDENMKTPIILAISGVIGAPLMEEVLFRGLILNKLLSKMKIWIAIIISSLLFAVSHLDFTHHMYVLKWIN